MGKIVKKSGIPKIASRKSLNIRTNFRKSTRKSFGVLRFVFVLIYVYKISTNNVQAYALRI